MAISRGLRSKAPRILSGLVIGCFFLPFFGISCDGFDVITISGADLAGGCTPSSSITDNGSGSAPKLDPVDREPLAILAFALAVAGFALAWVRSRGARVASLVVAIAGLGALVGLYLKVSGDLREAVAKEHDKGDKLDRQVKVDSGGRMGLWLAGFGLIATAGLAGRELRTPEPDAPPPGSAPS
jgi:hypothetical protein